MSSTRHLFLALAVAATAACDATTAPGGTRVGLSFAGARPAGAAAGFRLAQASLEGDSLVIVDGTDTLVITNAEVVAREIELRRVGVSCDTTGSDDDCEYFSLDARLVDVPLAPGTSQAITVEVPAGTYSSVRMKVHKVSDDAGDAAFLAANPTWPARQSLRVTGRFNGTPFTFLSDVNFRAEAPLTPNLVVDAATTTDLTVRIDLASWFRVGGTGALIDPATAGKGGANQNEVESNIKNSVRAFEDKDRDGDEHDG